MRRSPAFLISYSLAGSGHALGGSAFGTTCSLSPEDDPVGSFKIRPWRESKCLGSIKMIEPAWLNEEKKVLQSNSINVSIGIENTHE